MGKLPVQQVKLTVDDKISHKFESYGGYLKGCGEVSQETTEYLEEKLFKDINSKVFHQTFLMSYTKWEPEYKNFAEDEDHFNHYDIDALDKWIEMRTSFYGYGFKKFNADMKKYGAVWAMNMCGEFGKHYLSPYTAEQIYTGLNGDNLAMIVGNGAASKATTNLSVNPIKDECIETFVDKCINLIDRMIVKFEMPIKYISLYDEPNFGIILPYQMCRIVKLARKKLDEKGHTDVLINGPASAGLNPAYAQAMKEIDSEAFEMLNKITVHSFGSGMMELKQREVFKSFGKPLWITSTGAQADGKIGDLPINEKGERYDNSYVGGVLESSAFLIDVNLGASYIGPWWMIWDCKTSPLNNLHQYHMFLVDKTPGNQYLGKEIFTFKRFEYIRTILRAIRNDADVYYCESSEEGCMSERYVLSNQLVNQMAAVCVKNADGKWGISILNKTDSETRKKELETLYEQSKPHNLAGPSVLLEVELDIKPLYNSGIKKFKSIRTGKEGDFIPYDTVILEDGKGKVFVKPFDVVSLIEE